jgi:hypothetical protein
MNLKKFVKIVGLLMGHIMEARHHGHVIIALVMNAGWIGRMGRELFLLERENINRRVLKMVETVGELIDWLLAFEMEQEIRLEKIAVLPHRDGNPEIAGEYYQINGFLERVGNVNAGAGS